jgi:hypothetical protein
MLLRSFMLFFNDLVFLQIPRKSLKFHRFLFFRSPQPLPTISRTSQDLATSRGSKRPL